jgi:hypothetical protein
MENDGVTNSVIRFINKNGELTPQYLFDIKEKISVLRDLREKIDSALDRLKINIIKSNTHLLIDKVHRGDIETSLKILENTRDRSVFYDFITLFDELVVLNEQYLQKYENEYSDIKDIKDNLGLNDYKLFKIISEISLEK